MIEHTEIRKISSAAEIGCLNSNFRTLPKPNSHHLDGYDKYRKKTPQYILWRHITKMSRAACGA